MKRVTKLVLAVMLLLVLPMKQWGQEPYRQYSEDGILLNFHEIDNMDFRIFLLYTLSQDNRFVLIANDEPGQFSVSSDEDSGITNLYEAFDAFYNDTYASFGLLDKTEIYYRMSQWKSCVSPSHFQSIVMDIALRNSRSNSNNHCIDSDPFCTSDEITFDAATTSQTADDIEGTTLQDGCIYYSYNPSWYHMRIQTAGRFCIHLEGHDPNNSSTTRDVDFCLWGPFTDPTSPCVAQLTTNKIIDCSYSASYSEDIYLGYPESQHDHGYASHGTITYHVPEVGEYYILMLTNYSCSPCVVSFTKSPASDPGSTDCGILPGIVSNDGPYCVGETINLTVNQQAGATYSWSGPNGFTSTQRTPSRPNCTMAMAGTYTCIVTVGGETTNASTTVEVYAQPTANFTFNQVCQGEATQFTSTSTTNPTGQNITSYQWDFGDGQTGSGQSVTHTYAQAGTFPVTLTVTTGGHCTSEKTQNVIVYASPVANAGPDQTIDYGTSTQLNGSAGVTGNFTYQWEPANMIASGANTLNPQTVNLTSNQTYTLTITNPQGGCSSTDEVTIYIEGSAMTVSAQAQPSTICAGESTQLTANAGGGTGNFNYSWSPTTGLSNTHIYNPVATPQQTTTYSCTVSDGTTTQTVTVTITVNPMPNTNFNAPPVCLGNPTQFACAPAGQGATYQWDFGDGQTGTGQNVTHTYAQPGDYLVTIIVETAGGCSNQATQTVTVNPAPRAYFRATNVCQGDPTQFTSNAAGQGITSYLWDFNDGHTGTGQTVSHTYAQPGTYQVTLTVQTTSGCSDSFTGPVTVSPQPTASFSATTVCQGSPTEFTSSATGQVREFIWDFGDNQTGTGQNVSHTYAQAGTYPVTLTVRASGGCTAEVTQNVTVAPLPTANFNATAVCQGTPTQFTSTAQGEQINRYIWDFNDGQTGTGQIVTHTYAQPGTYQVTLNVQTAEGCSDDITKPVEVYAMPVASATAQPSTVLYGASTTLSANAGAQGTFNFHWEPADMVINPNSATTPTMPLQESTTFTVTITNPEGGCTSTAQVIVGLDGSGMMAMAFADKTDLCDGESTTIHAIPTGGAEQNYTYSWTPANTLSSANTQNPIATPGLGNTTYTCHVSDGFSDINVSVTLHVHPNVEHDIYKTICDNDYYTFFGNDLQTPGVYDHTLSTGFGCDSIVHLHLDNWQTYETGRTEHFCQNDLFDFYGEMLNAPGTYYHTLPSAHQCDSVIRLTLIQDPVYEFEMWESTCEGGPGYYFDGQYLQPRQEPYIFSYNTVKQCDSIIVLHVDEAEYNSKNYNVSLCATEFTWGSNGVTYYETGVYYDTLHFASTCDSTVVLNLELRPNYSDEVTVTSCDDYRWKNENYNVDMTFTQSTVYTHHYINTFGCDSEATLYLTINDHDEYEFTVPEEEACDEYFWDPRGHEVIYTDHEDETYNMTGIYQRTYKNVADCDSIVTMNIQMEYTPHPTPIYPMDLDNTTPHWVITASEFQINAYDFNLWDTNPNCRWDTVTWTCDEAPEWILEPFGDKAKCCKLYVLNKVEDTIWLKAHAFNRCAPEEGVEQTYWMVCSFYGVDDNTVTSPDFSVVPNPNKGEMTLNFDHLTGKVNVKVYDMKGDLIDNFETFNGNGPCTYTYYSKTKVEGIYFFVATGKEGTIAKKVVIQR